jgi:hypothetical protein
MHTRVQLDENNLSIGRRFVAARKTYFIDRVFTQSVDRPERMRRRPARRRFLGLCVIALAVTTALLVSYWPEPATKSEAQSIFPKPVRGYVWDSADTLIIGADVTVNIKQGEVIRSTLTDTTDSAGLYAVAFESDQWDVGDTIEVIASYSGSESPPNSTAATSALVQWVNATICIEIPEFSNVGKVLSVTGMVGILTMFVFARKRKQCK